MVKKTRFQDQVLERHVEMSFPSLVIRVADTGSFMMVSFQHLILESSFSFKLIRLAAQFACKFFWIPVSSTGMTLWKLW
ncbi:MAG: hypothetical protein ACR5LA_05805 [Wolbachia sp.]